MPKKIRGSQGEKLAKRGIDTTAVQKYNKNTDTLLAKQRIHPTYLRQAAKIYVAAFHSVAQRETIEISEQRTAFV